MIGQIIEFTDNRRQSTISTIRTDQYANFGSPSRLISYVRQKVRRIFEEQARWQESGPRRRAKCTSSTAYCVVNNYSIVASRGELARNNRATNETTTTSVTTKRRTSSIVNGRLHSKEESARSGILITEEESRKPKDVSKNSTRSGVSRSIQRGIIKSTSVPKDLKEGALYNF